LCPSETEFGRGIRCFGYLLTQITTVLVLIIFAINVILNKPLIDSFLFIIALAVGAAPIIRVTLSKGAQSMARQGVIVSQSDVIENLGSIDTLRTNCPLCKRRRFFIGSIQDFYEDIKGSFGMKFLATHSLTLISYSGKL
jgi:hypothetical protein